MPGQKMSCNAACGVLSSAWLPVGRQYTLSPVQEQRHWSSAAGMMVGYELEAVADCLWLQGRANDASAGRDADGAGPIGGASPVSRADERQPGRRVFPFFSFLCCCCAACPSRHPVAHGGQAPLHSHANMGGSAGFAGRPASVAVSLLQAHAQDHHLDRPRPAAKLLLRVSGRMPNTPSKLNCYLRQRMFFCKNRKMPSFWRVLCASLRSLSGSSSKSQLPVNDRIRHPFFCQHWSMLSPLLQIMADRILTLAAYACSTRGAGATAGSCTTEGPPDSPA